MTHNQIDYAKLQEDKRHNVEVESNNRNVLAENTRHNKAVEQIQHEANIINQSHYARMDAENARHNQSVEAETNRHNIAMEGIQNRQNQLAAQQLVIRQKELAETMSHNYAMEEIGWENAKANVINAEAHNRDSLVNFFNSGTQSDAQESNASLNSAKVDDLKNQSGNRTANTAINGTKTVVDVITTVTKLVSSGGRSAGVIVSSPRRRISGATR